MDGFIDYQFLISIVTPSCNYQEIADKYLSIL